MVDEKNTIVTPVSIEFNIPDSSVEFSIETACQELFMIMSTQDPTLRVLHSGQNTLLWDSSTHLPKDERFYESFHMKKQTYRKGNSKVTIYCVVEGNYTINKLKFSDPLQNYLWKHNVWIKPDFYSTKTVGSPGYITLIHPKWTDKSQLARDISDALSITQLDNDDDIVAQWRKKYASLTDYGTTLVPNFHIETTVKKWGQLQVEVLSMYCSKEDSKYLKMLCVEASSQKKLRHGVFVPTGIHLLEGKDVVADILKEQQTFLQRTTSVQLNGISVDTMYKIQTSDKNVHQLLRSGPGVHSVERTYFTETRGQWLVVVQQDKVTALTEFITRNLNLIYNHSQQLQPKLVTYSNDTTRNNYRMIFVDKSLSRVGTYAEALRRRFQPEKTEAVRTTPTETNEIKQSTHSQHTSGALPNDRVEPKENIKHPRPATVFKDQSMQDTGHQTRRKDTVNRVQNSNNETQKNSNERREQNTDHDEKTLASLIDSAIERKLSELKEQNQSMMETLETKIHQKIDKTLEKRFREVSILVANSVTERIVRAMNKKLETRNKTEETTEDNLIPVITQSTPSKQQGTTIISDQGQWSATNKCIDPVESTKKMLEALPTIEDRKPSPRNPPHDTQIGLTDELT